MKRVNLVARIDCARPWREILGVPNLMPFFLFVVEDGDVYTVYDWSFERSWGSYLKQDWSVRELAEHVAKENGLGIWGIHYY